MASPAPSIRERFLGCILGQAVGDAIGAPFEGLPSDAIFRDFGGAAAIVAKPPVDILYYTDDTQMMIGVAECLLSNGCVDQSDLLRIFAGNYDPKRGYGPGARKLFDAIQAGKDPLPIIRNGFPGGSLGNGAAMRVAPIGLVFHHDHDWLREEAKLSAEVTHVHPIGIDGAVILSKAVALAVTCAEMNADVFYRQLREFAMTEEFQWQLSSAANLGPNTSITFGNSLEAHRSVTSATMCFTSAPNSYVNAISSAIGLGNDTDTLAAMAGALAGAYLGINAIPKHLLDLLENGKKGRDYLEELALKLYELSVVARSSG